MKLETGLRVRVFFKHSSGEEKVCEGEGVLVEFMSKDPEDPYHQRWKVRFSSDGELYSRWVHRKHIVTRCKVNTKYGIEALREMDSLKLRNLIKKDKNGKKIVGLSKMPKEELVKILDPRDPVEAFLQDGGKVQKLKPQRIPKRKPPTDKSAECNIHLKNGKKFKAAKNTKKLAKSDRVGIQQLAEEAGITAFKTRRILRDFSVAKPDNQWYWKRNDPALQEILKLLKGE
jgi:hypothetical protein